MGVERTRSALVFLKLLMASLSRLEFIVRHAKSLAGGPLFFVRRWRMTGIVGSCTWHVH